MVNVGDSFLNMRKVREEGSKKILVNIQILNKKRNGKGNAEDRKYNRNRISKYSLCH